MWQKQVVCSLVIIYFDSLNLACNKNKLHKTLYYWSGEMLNFDFLEIDLEIVSSPHFVYDVSQKMLLVLYSINWSNLIVWLS